MRRLHAALGFLGLLTTAACYSYQTIPLDDVRPDLPVRLRVKPEATERVAAVVGYSTQDVTGTVSSVNGDTILLTVRVSTASQASVAQQLYQRLDVPISQLIEVEQRHLNRTKTYACVAVVAAGAGALAVWAFTSPSVFGSQSTPPVTNNSLAPGRPLSRAVLRLPIGHLRPGP